MLHYTFTFQIKRPKDKCPVFKQITLETPKPYVTGNLFDKALEAAVSRSGIDPSSPDYEKVYNSALLVNCILIHGD